MLTKEDHLQRDHPKRANLNSKVDNWGGRQHLENGSQEE